MIIQKHPDGDSISPKMPHLNTLREVPPVKNDWFSQGGRDVDGVFLSLNGADGRSVAVNPGSFCSFSSGF